MPERKTGKLTVTPSETSKLKTPPEGLKPYMASFIDATDDVTGVKIIPGHIETFAQYGDVCRITMASGATWYVRESADIVDAKIKSWYTRVAV